MQWGHLRFRRSLISSKEVILFPLIETSYNTSNGELVWHKLVQTFFLSRAVLVNRYKTKLQLVPQSGRLPERTAQRRRRVRLVSVLSCLISDHIPALEACDVEQQGHKAGQLFMSGTVKLQLHCLALWTMGGSCTASPQKDFEGFSAKKNLF